MREVCEYVMSESGVCVCVWGGYLPAHVVRQNKQEPSVTRALESKKFLTKQS